MNNYQMQAMTWTEYRDALKSNPLLLLPVGALEQHGPHLPMATDAIFAEDMALRVADQLSDELPAIVMPRLSYGYKSQARSGGGQTFLGTTSLDGATLCAQVRDIVRELARHGVSRLAIIDGHYENQWFITEAIDLALRELSTGPQQMKIVRCEYWDYCPVEVLEDIFEGEFPGVDLEHAALIETSMMLALHPGQVRADKIPVDTLAEFVGHDHYPQDGRGVPESGVLAPVANACADKGWQIINGTVAAMSTGFRAEFL